MYKNLSTNEKIVSLLAFLIGCFHLLNAAGVLILSTLDVRIFHLLVMMLIIFISKPLLENKDNSFFRFINLILIFLALLSFYHLLSRWEEIALSGGDTETIDAIAGLVIIFLVLEATRRGIGFFLTLICLIFFTYPFYSQYLPGVFEGRGYTPLRMSEFLTTTSEGVFGVPIGVSATYIILFTIFGSFLTEFGAGDFFFKVSKTLTKNLRAAGAKTAVVFSTLVGMISGAAASNVAVTGVMTIPMMKKEGYQSRQAGAIEAVVSTGGQIMPPVMGVAAFVLASLTAVPYSSVIIAAVIPAIFYFFCLFLSVVFQSRKQNIQAIGELTEDMRLGLQDFLNLIMILAPIMLILVLLLTDKGAVGCGLFGGVLGAERIITVDGCNVISLSWGQQLVQNAGGDAGSAGWMAVLLLLALLFLDPEVRAKPKKIIDGLSQAGILISTLYLMFLAVSIIDFCLNFTGLPTFLALDVLQWLQSLNLGNGGPLVFQLVALFMTMFIAILLGMGMPAVPAYINVALLMGPVLAGLGIATFTAHMFIFYFAVASAITPPVALAAFAAASITNAGPMGTAFSAVKSGIVMFIIPFVFALYPEILLIEEGMIEAGTNSGAVKYLSGYDGTVDIKALGLLLFRLVIALYLISSALARFDSGPLGSIEVILRIGLAILLLFKAPLVFGFAIVGAAILIGAHKLRYRSILAA